MKQFEDIQKRMPYAESKDYLNRLIEQSTEQAILQAGKPKARVRTLRPLITSAAAAAILLLIIAVTQLRPASDQLAEAELPQDTITLAADNALLADASDGPIDEFLNTLTDDEAQQLSYYEIEEEPEYD